MSKKRVLWVGDSPTVATGFGRATKYIVDSLKNAFDVEVLGMHYKGDPQHEFPYDIWPTRADILGARRLPERCKAFKPDVIILQNDVWNIPHYIKELRKERIDTPVIAALAVDGKNVQAQKLDGITHAIFWTKFAQDEAAECGYTGTSDVIPLGVDLSVYRLADTDHIEPLRAHARTRFEKVAGSNFDIDGFRKGFVVTNVNRNQQRKRLDLTVQFFCEWVNEKQIDDAYLMIQACPTGEQEYDVMQLMEYYGLSDRLFLIYPDIEHGVPESDLVWTYRCANVCLTTTQGEGFGLTTLEMMAVGIPVVAPNWAALSEICADAALLVPCTSFAATQKGVNAIGGVADRVKAIEALDVLYRDKDLRHELSCRGIMRAQEERFRWENIGLRYVDVIDRVLAERESLEDAWADLGRPEESIVAS